MEHHVVEHAAAILENSYNTAAITLGEYSTHGGVVKSRAREARWTRVYISSMFLTSWVTSGRISQNFEPQFFLFLFYK